MADDERTRPTHRQDGIPTRADLRLMSPAERAIRDAVLAVEAAGASRALTDAVQLLQRAQGRVADHIEGRDVARAAVGDVP